MQLERESWTEAMRHPREQILERVHSSLPKIFVLEMEQQVVGSICTQRIDDIDRIPEMCWAHEDDLYSMEGRVLQLLRVNTFLESKPAIADGVAVGAILRDFCLAYAEGLDFKEVCAVTKTTDYSNEKEVPYAAYVDARDEKGHSPDSGLNFHVSRGAEVVTVLPAWRPEDVENEGHGVLIVYNIHDSELVCDCKSLVSPCPLLNFSYRAAYFFFSIHRMA